MVKRFASLIAILDSLIVGATAYIFLQASVSNATAWIPVLIAILAWRVISHWLRLGRARHDWSWPAVTSELLLGTGLLCGAAAWWAHHSGRSAGSWVAVCLALTLALTLIRAMLLSFLRQLHKNGKMRRVVLIGAPNLASLMHQVLNRHPELCRNVVGELHPWHSDFKQEGETDAPPMGTADLIQLLQEKKVREALVLMPGSEGRELNVLLQRCRTAGIFVSILLPTYELHRMAPHLEVIEGLPILNLREAGLPLAARIIKRALDLTLSIPLLIFSTPLVLWGAILVRMRGVRVFVREERVGQNGKTFRLLRLNVPREEASILKRERMMRRLSIAELPQLWNVVRGEMSLVGPQPETAHSVKNYSEWQSQRLNVKPGLTGLAQVEGLRLYHPVEQKARFDLQYLHDWSLAEDIIILVRTLLFVLQRSIKHSNSDISSWTAVEGTNRC